MVDQVLARRRRAVRVLGYDVALSELGPDARRELGPGMGPEMSPGMGPGMGLGMSAGEPPVVLVHGIGMSGRYFGPLSEVLAATDRVLVPDLPGFGDSTESVQRPLTVEEHADVVTALLETLDAQGAVLVGHSMGAQIVTEAAARRPGLVAGIVLIGPVTEPGARSLPRQALRLLRDGLRESLATDRLMVADWWRTGPRRYAGTLPYMRDYPLEDRLREVHLPTLLVRGSRDPVTPAGYLHRLAAAAPQGRVAEVPGGAHAAMLHSPELVALLVRGLV
jgi:pimeloyl-ACP methyl ester carboxylesterase